MRSRNERQKELATGWLPRIKMWKLMKMAVSILPRLRSFPNHLMPTKLTPEAKTQITEYIFNPYCHMKLTPERLQAIRGKVPKYYCGSMGISETEPISALLAHIDSLTEELESKTVCEKCRWDKVCVSPTCCPHPIEWHYYKGQSSKTCLMCGGTVLNPDFISPQNDGR